MKRALVVIALAALVVPACTRTVIERVVVSPAEPAGETAALDARGRTIVRLVERVRPAVVNVTTDTFSPSLIGGGGGRGVGSGFIVRPDGIVVTNYHVVERAQRITVITPPPNPERYEARVIGGDPSADLAVLKIDAQGLPTIPLGSSAELKLGQPVVAIGYALALEGGPTVTAGIVSALDRTISAQDPACDPSVCPNGLRTYTHVIQTDAAINPGNSGGPLLNLAGEVVGINSAGAGQAENIGFAIAIDAAKPTIERAIEHPAAPVAYLGVVTEDVTEALAFQFGLPVTQGAYVVDLAPKGPADEAGVRVGDVIVSFDGKPVPDSDTLGELIRARAPGDRVPLVVVSPDGSRRSLVATLGVNPLPRT